MAKLGINLSGRYWKKRKRNVTMYQLHYFPANASAAPHMLLEELGVDYALSLVDRANKRSTERTLQ
jgi:hypothetical protein